MHVRKGTIITNTTISSPVVDKPARPSRQMAKFYNSYMTITMPILWVICHFVARIDMLI